MDIYCFTYTKYIKHHLCKEWSKINGIDNKMIVFAEDESQAIKLAREGITKYCKDYNEKVNAWVEGNPNYINDFCYLIKNHKKINSIYFEDECCGHWRIMES